MRLIVNKSGRLEISKNIEPIVLRDGFGNGVEVSRSGGFMVFTVQENGKQYIFDHYLKKIMPR